MKKWNRKVSWAIIITLIIILFVILPFALLLMLNQGQLDHEYNQQEFDGIVSSIRLCILSSDGEQINAEWIYKNCSNVDASTCQGIEYENKVLSIQKCTIRNEVFSYRKKISG